MIKWIQTISKDGIRKIEVVYNSNDKEHYSLLLVPRNAIAFQFITLEDVLPGETALFLDKLKFSPWYIRQIRYPKKFKATDSKCVYNIGDKNKGQYTVRVGDSLYIEIAEDQEVVVI